MKQPHMTGWRRRRRRWGWLFLAPLTLLPMRGVGSAQREAPQGWEEVEAHKKADVAANLLTTTLQAQLSSALSSGGPLKAMRVCSDVAQSVTAQLSRRQGLSVRRTALRVRNPANHPDAFERAWLEEAEKSAAQGVAPAPVYEIVRGENGGCELRHLRPILFPGGACSQCHGRPDEISPEVNTALRKRYPHDEAIGFAPGDLQGAISVRVAVREPCLTQ